MPEQSHFRSLEADILLWIARLPLIPASDLELLTGASDDAVRRALDALRRHGWIERLAFRPSEYEHEFEAFAVRDVAIPAFARAFGLKQAEVRRHWALQRSDLLDRIINFGVSDAINNALVQIAARCREEVKVEVADLRVLPRRRYAGCPWPPDVQVYGQIHIGWSASPHFFLIWDRVNASTMGVDERVRTWFDADAACSDWVFPWLLIVVPSAEREREWSVAIRAEAGRRDDARLEANSDDFDPYEYAWLRVAFIRPEDIGGPYALDRWRNGSGGESLSLFEILGWERARPPLTPPSPPRLNLIDRGVDTQAPSLREWAEHLLVSGQGSAQERVAAQLLTLGPAHRDALAHLARHPYLTNREIAITLGVTEEETRRLIADLDRYGLTGSLQKEQA